MDILDLVQIHGRQNLKYKAMVGNAKSLADFHICSRRSKHTSHFNGWSYLSLLDMVDCEHFACFALNFFIWLWERFGVLWHIQASSQVYQKSPESHKVFMFTWGLIHQTHIMEEPCQKTSSESRLRGRGKNHLWTEKASPLWSGKF